jgi:hypothetical protein
MSDSPYNDIDHLHVRNAIHLDFERDRHEPLYFFGSVIRPLRDDFDLRWGKIRIRVYWHPLKRNDAGDGDERRKHQDEESLPK